MKYTLKRTDPSTIISIRETELYYGDFDQCAEKYLAEIERDDDERNLLHVEADDGTKHFPAELPPKEMESLLPRHYFAWEICDRCRGEGTCLIDGLEGVAFTASEFDEAFDPEEQESYFGGGYDRACPDCAGTGKVLALDVEKLERRAPLLAKERQEWIDDAYAARMEYEAERRMGA
jgi:hypothetical protein